MSHICGTYFLFICVKSICPHNFICHITAHRFQIPTFDTCVTYMSHTYVAGIRKIYVVLVRGGFGKGWFTVNHSLTKNIPCQEYLII